jgi:hypothetical protein
MTFSAQLRSILQKMVSCNLSLDYELIMTFSAQLSSILQKMVSCNLSQNFETAYLSYG